MTPALKLRASNIDKAFPGVQALNQVSLAVKRGTVHALCGENGAGKSTLMKIFIGLLQPDAGHILIDEQPVAIRNPIEARRLGISMIFQELNYIPEMTVEESFCVGNWPVGRLGRVSWNGIRARASDLLAQEHLSYSPKARLKDLSVSDLQMLEIVKAISYNSDILIMDEPTSAITTSEAEILFAKIDDLRRRGHSILYISHKMDEIFRLADDITVLRDGCLIDSRPRDQYDPDTLITQMVGRKLETTLPQEPTDFGHEALRVEHLSKTGKFHDVSFHVRAGEIVGFAGLVGAGRTDVMLALFGLAPADAGQIRLRGRNVSIRNVADSIACKMVLLSEDRRRYGIIPVRSVRENVSLSTLRQFLHHGWHHAAKESRTVQDTCRSMDVRTPSIEASAATLSGGNQQKLLLARWMLTDPDILLLDEPTRGIDVGAKQEIYKLMRALTTRKKALVMVSSELPELLAMCDRIYVMAKGCITGMLTQDQFSQEHILALATGAQRPTEGTL
jgi:inositol transport system ATP-binding protein